MLRPVRIDAPQQRVQAGGFSILVGNVPAPHSPVREMPGAARLTEEPRSFSALALEGALRQSADATAKFAAIAPFGKSELDSSPNCCLQAALLTPAR